MPFPIFILTAALLISLIVLAILAILNRVFDLMNNRWNGMHLYLGLKIYPKEKAE